MVVVTVRVTVRVRVTVGVTVRVGVAMSELDKELAAIRERNARTDIPALLAALGMCRDHVVELAGDSQFLIDALDAALLAKLKGEIDRRIDAE